MLTLKKVKELVEDLNEKKQLLLDALEKAKEPTLSDLLVDYFNLRNEQRSDWSGKPVVEREKGWFCENRECRFVLWKDNAFFKRLGKRLDAHVADKLLRDGRVRLKDCKSAKGKTYNATVLLSCEADGRSKFSLEFEGGC